MILTRRVWTRTWPFIASSTIIRRWWATTIASTTSVTSTIVVTVTSQCKHTHILYWLSHNRGTSLKCTENTGCIFGLWSQHSCHWNFTMYGPQTPGRDEDYHCPCHESIQWSRSIAPAIPNPQHKKSNTQWTRDCTVRGASLDILEKRKISCSCQEWHQWLSSPYLNHY